MQSHESWNHIFWIKIGFIVHFQSCIAFLCILIRLKRNHSRGHVACSPSARGDLCGLSGAWRTRRNTREGFSVRALGTRGDSGDIRRNSPGWGTRDTCRTRRLPGEVSLSGLTAHSGLPGLALGFGTRGHVSCSEGDSEWGFEGAFGWLPGHVAFFERFRRRFRRRLRRGHSAGLRDGSERVFGTRGTLRRAPKGGASGWHVPKRSSKEVAKGSSGRLVPKGSSKEVGLPEGLSRGSSKEVAKGSSGRAAMVVGSKM